ncbi:MAG: acetolactate synthase [Methanobacterium sp. BRmetb2]|jgi:acetolactate synthase-1/2/3 large subunit|nr:MAG: acetolactate synthase [Methanobacterium sp. BRmetb2]
MKSSSEDIRCADALVKILEENGIKFIFGHPGEQILPFYDALRKSKIKHVLMRHEQGAAHAADGYARSSGKFGVCIATAGPGALNLVMGVATAYKDSVPLLVITGDVPTDLAGGNVFQEIDLESIFRPITIETFQIKESEEAINSLKKAIKMLKNGKTGPIHLNIPKNIFNYNVNHSSIQKEVEYHTEKDLSQLNSALKTLETSKKPLIVAGSGVMWGNARNELEKFVNKYSIPVATTYHARGVISEEHPLCLGMVGLRGTDAANFAGKNCDLVIGLGCRFSERTWVGINQAKIIHVNLDPDVLIGDYKVCTSVKEFLTKIIELNLKIDPKWLQEINQYEKYHHIKTDYKEKPLKPQKAVKEILDGAADALIVNDAGVHTTFVTLLRRVKKPGSLIFSGGFGPMGYALPASVGVALARRGETVVVITGDGGFQMTLQELATIAQEKLPILICIINNSSLGIIKQWQDLYYNGRYEVEMENPDFVELAKSYGIDSSRIDSPGAVIEAVKKVINLKKPYLIDIIVDSEEGIPLPQVLE